MSSDTSKYTAVIHLCVCVCVCACGRAGGCVCMCVYMYVMGGLVRSKFCELVCMYLRQEDSTCTKPVARVNEIHSVGGKTQKPIFGGLV